MYCFAKNQSLEAEIGFDLLLDKNLKQIILNGFCKEEHLTIYPVDVFVF